MMKIPVIPGDKANHGFWGSAVFAVVSTVVSFWSRRYARPAGIMAAALAGLFTEWRQAQLNKAAIAAGNPPPHTVDGWDAAATVMGAVYLLACITAMEGVQGHG
jgi:hypothetical protein